MSNIPPSAKILFEEAKAQGLNPIWESKFGLFSIKKDSKTIYIYTTKLSINSDLGGYLTSDKYTSRLILGKNNLPNIPSCFSTDRGMLNGFFEKNHPLIAKPVFGEKSDGVKLIKTKEELFKLPLKEILFEKYIEGIEFRYLILNNQVIAAQRKELAPVKTHPWRKKITNLEKRSFDKTCVDLSLKTAKIIGQSFLAVDFIKTQNELYVLELNSIPGLYSFHNPDQGPKYNIAGLLLEAIIKAS